MLKHEIQHIMSQNQYPSYCFLSCGLEKKDDEFNRKENLSSSQEPYILHRIQPCWNDASFSCAWRHWPRDITSVAWEWLRYTHTNHTHTVPHCQGCNSVTLEQSNLCLGVWGGLAGSGVVVSRDLLFSFLGKDFGTLTRLCPSERDTHTRQTERDRDGMNMAQSYWSHISQLTKARVAQQAPISVSMSILAHSVSLSLFHTAKQIHTLYTPFDNWQLLWFYC